MSRLAAIFGCAALTLGAEEAAFFADARPWGFILFRRNVETPAQVRALVDALRRSIDAPDAPVLIDQEGGRVQRLGPPHWRRYPPAAAYREVAAGAPGSVRDLVRLGARLIAHDLASLGINVDCLPVLDLPQPGAHDIIGDRAYAATPEDVALLGRAACEGLMAGGVLPVLKHMPGHGRARADSHERLPVVDDSVETLEAHDFAPFRLSANMPLAMTAHVVYAAIDPQRPATTSPRVIGEVIRNRIGFDGVLMTDDLSMKALSGDYQTRARAALEAGCDVVLHCNGSMDEMKAVAAGARPLAGAGAGRTAAALARLGSLEPFDAEAARARFDAAFEGRWAA